MVTDDVIEHYADSYLPASKIVELMDVQRNTIMRWERNGLVRVERLEKIEKNKPFKFYHFGDCVAARNARPKPLAFKYRKFDGVVHYQCNVCSEWKTREDYYEDKSNKMHGILSRCKKCHNKGARLRDKTPEGKKKISMRKRSMMKKRSLDAKLATEWSENPTISARVVMQQLEAVRPNSTDRDISFEARMHEDTVRNIRRKAERDGSMYLSTIDTIFTNLNEPEAFIRVTEKLDEQRPRWHEKYDYCQMCLRTKIPYMASGLCATCYRNRNDESYKPMTDSGWSNRYACCVRCYSTDSTHSGFGLCRRCYQQKARCENRAATCG